MKDQPAGVDPRPVLRAWGIEAVEFSYLPVGFGDHHWAVVDDRGRRWFVTVADLANKNHCGIGVPAAWEGLRRAMDTAASLADADSGADVGAVSGTGAGPCAGAGPSLDAGLQVGTGPGLDSGLRAGTGGLDFVVAPVRTPGGETVVPLGERHAVSVFPYLDGESGRFGDESEPVGDLLDRLHRASPPASTPVADPELPGRGGLEEALASLGRPWTGGPYAEPARALVADHLAGLRRRLVEFDRRRGELRGELVVTHGEPHPGNVVRVGARRMLVDWDTVGLAVPERDLWWLADTPATPAAEFYRLRWDLDDVSVFVEQFRASHTRGPDTEQAWAGLVGYVERLSA